MRYRTVETGAVSVGCFSHVFYDDYLVERKGKPSDGWHKHGRIVVQIKLAETEEK